MDFGLLVSFLSSPVRSSRPPPLLPTLPDPRRGRQSLVEGAARDPERKGPSLGPNAGGVSLDRRRLGTTAGTGDKVTYQSRFGAHADTPLSTGNAELFKRPYRLLYLSPRKASCRETKDVPYLEIQGGSPPHKSEGLRRRRPIRVQGEQTQLPRRVHKCVCAKCVRSAGAERGVRDTSQDDLYPFKLF